MNINPVTAGCGVIQINSATVLHLSCDPALIIWLVRPDGSKEIINQSEVTLPDGRTLEDLIKSIRGYDDRRENAEENIQQSIARLTEAISCKARSQRKDRDLKQEKYRRRYHGRKK